jgi:hypothetical protein
MEPRARGIYRTYLEGLRDADVRELAIHRQGEPLELLPPVRRGLGGEGSPEARHYSGAGHVDMVKDAGRWEVEPERWASEIDTVYYRKLLEKAWEEAGVVFQ